MRTGEKETNGTDYRTRRISLVAGARETETKEYELGEVLSWIKSGKGRFSQRIKEIRKAASDGDSDRVSRAKESLPAAMFSGIFKRRAAKDIESHTGILCLDFDHLEDAPERIEQMKYDPHIIASFLSPSGHGIKTLIAVPADIDKHRQSFESASIYMKTCYDLEADKSGKDVSRLCFLSADEKLYENYEAFELPLKTIESRPKYEKTDGDRPGDKYIKEPGVREKSARLLQDAGWKIGHGDADKTYCTRPHKERGIGGTLWHDGGFYCFSDNASPLAGSEYYNPFSLFTTLRHGGDFKAAVLDLVEQGYGDQPKEKVVQAPVEASTEEEKEQVAEKLPIWTSAADIPQDLSKRIMMKYPVLVDGLLHRGTKMILGGGSKSYKTWTLLNLGMSVASGNPWFGKEVAHTTQDVIFINFEVAHEFFLQRVKTVASAMEITQPKNFKIWSLRGICNDLTIILQSLIERIDNGASLIIIDPIYKGLGGRDENSAGMIGELMNEVEQIVEKTGAAVAFGAHYSKGNQAEKDPLDRVSGSGVFARDPDSILGLTQHEEQGCFSVHSALRNFPGLDPFVVEWDFPLFKMREDLDPHRLKKPGQKTSTGSILGLLQANGGEMQRTELVEKAKTELGIGRSTVYDHINRLINTKKITEFHGYLRG